MYRRQLPCSLLRGGLSLPCWHQRGGLVPLLPLELILIPTLGRGSGVCRCAQRQRTRRRILSSRSRRFRFSSRTRLNITRCPRRHLCSRFRRRRSRRAVDAQGHALWHL